MKLEHELHEEEGDVQLHEEAREEALAEDQQEGEEDKLLLLFLFKFVIYRMKLFLQSFVKPDVMFYL